MGKLSNLKIFNSLEKLLIKLSNLIYKSSINENALSKIEIKEIVKILVSFKNILANLDRKNKTVESLNSLILFFKYYLTYGKTNIKLLEKFKGWWGHGTKQVSFVRT